LFFPVHEGTIRRLEAAISAGETLDPVYRESARIALRSGLDGQKVTLAAYIATREAEMSGYRSAAGRAWLSRAISDFRRGLSHAPSDGFAWMRLAGAIVVRDGRTAEAADALRLSLYTTRFASGSPPLQMALAHALWDKMDSGTRLLTLAAIRNNFANAAGRKALEPFAQTSNGIAVLTEAVGQDPAGARQLRDWIAALAQGAGAASGTGLRR
jgi:hypothetical protein